ncbi:cupin domain-containing protein [Spirochaeta isovalerica]|uniref:Quercetin dioxygenase-like cupin family protein n=1 Tax=Spirochaeta isovalerica TaxID=150 RepID=A0A841RHK4_9SPIO|nr:cupin domain-containing protein [Spirochaeta isovalerica]MBB6481782.1 quercetin dioxygenase-like cupin family protein [Spirochaeta isovalerica]
MPILKNKDMKKIELNMEGIKNAVKQTAISPAQGWDGHVMRIFTLGKEGYTPKHEHSWPHINYIIKGEGTLFIDGEERPVEAGDTAFVPGGEMHQFRNTGNEDFSFICIVPEEGDK